MNALVGPILAVVLSIIMMVASYRLVGFNEGKSEAWKAVWWWMTVIAVVVLAITIIITGTVIQRIYF